MSPRYDPQAHIRRLEAAPRAEHIIDQREITVQTYQTTLSYEHGALAEGLESAWLTPQIRFGVFSRRPLKSQDEHHVVLGLQDDLSVRAYDYDKRQPLWFSWKNLVVDTVAIRYFRDEDGFLRFTTTGGGRRISDKRLQEFNSSFLGIPEDAVSKLHFDLDKLRDLCFGRFVDRLYMVKFCDAAAEEYRSIDHTEFKSRKYIDPAAGRLKEIRTDPQVKIESFDSDLPMRSRDLASEIQVRFFIRGLSGSLRLRFPKVPFAGQIKTIDEQASVFYRLVDATVHSILDADYFARQRLSLEELEKYVGFPEMADTTPFREALSTEELREQFFSKLDLGSPKHQWLPHLRAIDELVGSDVVAVHVATLLGALGKRDPGQMLRLLATCQADGRMFRVGPLVATELAAELRAHPVEMRAHAEEGLLAWAIEREEDSWTS